MNGRMSVNGGDGGLGQGISFAGTGGSGICFFIFFKRPQI